MIDKLLFQVLEQAKNAITKGASTATKAISDHFVKHGSKYVIGGGAAVVSGTAYAVGESVGHIRGKREGTAEQAARDEKKMNDQHQKHENDRKRWNEEKQAYCDIGKNGKYQCWEIKEND